MVHGVIPAVRGDVIVAFNALGFDARGFGSGDYIAARAPRTDEAPLPYSALKDALAAATSGDVATLAAILKRDAA